MAVSQDVHELDVIFGQIQTVIDKRLEGEEFEVRIQALDASGAPLLSLNEQEWLHALTMIKNSESYKRPKLENSIVNIYHDNIRQIVTRGQEPTWEKKFRRGTVDLDMGDYHRLRFSLSNEMEISDPFRAGPVEPKFIRDRKRISFESKDGSHRVDFTKVNGNLELEIEFFGRRINVNTIMTGILWKFFDLFGTPIQDTMYYHESVNRQSLQLLNWDKPSWPFSRPHSLTKENLSELGKKRYAVTNKLDGERMFAVFLPDGLFFTNDTKTLIVNMPTPKNIVGTILDGEYYNKTLWVFDALQLDGEGITDLDLTERWEKTVEWYNGLPESIMSYLKLKSYFSTGNLAHDLVSMEKYVNANFQPDENDGFIFTPVFSSYYDNISLKWKPTDQMTIDFVLELEELNSNRHNVVDEYRRKVPSSSVSLWSSAKGRLVIFRGSREYPWNVRRMPILNDELEDLFPVIRQGERSHVVEMRWNQKIGTFEPLRIRSDKTWPNNINVAIANWNATHNPLTFRDLLEFLLEHSNNTAGPTWNPLPPLAVIKRSLSPPPPQRNPLFAPPKFPTPPRVSPRRIELPQKRTKVPEATVTPSAEFVVPVNDVLQRKKKFIVDRTQKGHIIMVVNNIEDVRFVKSEPIPAVMTTGDAPTDTDILFNLACSNVSHSLDCHSSELREALNKRLAETIYLFANLSIFSQPSLEKLVSTLSTNSQASTRLFGYYVDGEQLKHNLRSGPINLPSGDGPPVLLKLGDDGNEAIMVRDDIIVKTIQLSNDNALLFNKLMKKYNWSSKVRRKGIKDSPNPRMTDAYVFYEFQKNEQYLDILDEEDIEDYTIAYEDPRDFTYRRIGTDATGSCFFHSVLRLIIPEFKDMTHKQRVKLSREVRADLADSLTFEEYLHLSNGTIAGLALTTSLGRKTIQQKLKIPERKAIELIEEINKLQRTGTQLGDDISKRIEVWIRENIPTAVPKMRDIINVIQQKNFKQYQNQLRNPKNWVGTEVLEVIQNKFGVNIFLIDGSTGLPYITGSQDLIVPGRRSIVILWVGGCHYEALVAEYEGVKIVEWAWGDPFIEWMYSFIE